MGTQDHDAIVLGAGHNGLTCACYLARAGLSVLVVEANEEVGGLTVTEEITAPGFHSDLHAFGYQFASLSPAPDEPTPPSCSSARSRSTPTWPPTRSVGASWRGCSTR